MSGWRDLCTPAGVLRRARLPAASRAPSSAEVAALSERSENLPGCWMEAGRGFEDPSKRKDLGREGVAMTLAQSRTWRCGADDGRK